MACVTSKKGGIKKEYAGNYGQTYYTLLPIPGNPPLVKDKYGYEWLLLGDTDEEFYRVAKPLPNGEVDIATLGHKRKDSFPDYHL